MFVHTVLIFVHWNINDQSINQSICKLWEKTKFRKKKMRKIMSVDLCCYQISMYYSEMRKKLSYLSKCIPSRMNFLGCELLFKKNDIWSVFIPKYERCCDLSVSWRIKLLGYNIFCILRWMYFEISFYRIL